MRFLYTGIPHPGEQHMSPPTHTYAEQQRLLAGAECHLVYKCACLARDQGHFTSKLHRPR